MVKNITPAPFLFLSSHPSIDWVNTLIVDKEVPVELIRSFEDWVRWLVQSGLILPKAGHSLLERWTRTEKAEAAIAHAKKWRQTFRDHLLKIEKTGKIHPELIAEMNRRIKKARVFREMEIEWEHGRLVKHVRTPLQGPEQLITLIVESAVDFLMNADLKYLHKCANPACVLHFYDQSKAHARRWCSMQICGNRHKVNRHYNRHK